ncbi:MAG: hypothetical protein R2800_04830 [Flavipsychrobacter sp.]
MDISTPNSLKENRIVLLLLFLLYITILPRDYMIYDFDFWTNWAIYIHQHGITDVYNNDFMVDYHPIYLYLIWIYDKIQGNEFSIVQNINYLKLIPLFFDFLPIFILCGFRQKIVPYRIPFLFLLLNIAYMYTTLIWGQVDSVYCNLVFLALIVGFYKPVWSAALFALALGTKLQAIIYLPVLVIVWVYAVQNIKQAILLLATMCSTILLIALPFILAGNGSQLLAVVTSAVGRYPHVSVSGFNIWYLIYSGNPNHTVDTDTYFLLSFKNWGLLLFFIFSGITLLTVLFKAIRMRLEATDKDELVKLLLLAGGLVTLYFYYFNTQMHERYAHAMIILFFFYGVYTKKYRLYILCSIPYFLSLEKSFPEYLDIEHYKFLFASKVIALWYTLTIGYAMYEFFKLYRPKREYLLLKEAWQKTKTP